MDTAAAPVTGLLDEVDAGIARRRAGRVPVLADVVEAVVVNPEARVERIEHADLLAGLHVGAGDRHAVACETFTAERAGRRDGTVAGIGFEVPEDARAIAADRLVRVFARTVLAVDVGDQADALADVIGDGEIRVAGFVRIAHHDRRDLADRRAEAGDRQGEAVRRGRACRCHQREGRLAIVDRHFDVIGIVVAGREREAGRAGVFGKEADRGEGAALVRADADGRTDRDRIGAVCQDGLVLNQVDGRIAGACAGAGIAVELGRGGKGCLVRAVLQFGIHPRHAGIVEAQPRHGDERDEGQRIGSSDCAALVLVEPPQMVKCAGHRVMSYQSGSSVVETRSGCLTWSLRRRSIASTALSAEVGGIGSS